VSRAKILEHEHAALSGQHGVAAGDGGVGEDDVAAGVSADDPGAGAGIGAQQVAAAFGAEFAGRGEVQIALGASERQIYGSEQVNDGAAYGLWGVSVSFRVALGAKAPTQGSDTRLRWRKRKGRGRVFMKVRGGRSFIELRA
jgi:hypothetical protein